MTEEKLTQEQTDEKMIDEAFQELLDQYLKSKHRKKVEIITKAFNFARQAHKECADVRASLIFYILSL